MAYKKITPVILSGGHGTRLWPLSRASCPKQFIPLSSNKSLFEDTFSRCQNTDLFTAATIICAQKHRFLIKKCLTNETSTEAAIIMEPCGRNTAAAVCTAALASKNPEDIILILPSDHFIPSPQNFHKTIAAAKPLAEQGYLVTFGIQPTSAHTGFGYIESGREVKPGFSVKTFHEKPNQAKADEYIKSHNFFWNSGIFMMRADVLLEELKAYAPDILEATTAAYNHCVQDLGDILLSPKHFATVRPDSIDFAILEKTDKAVIMPASFRWSDLGSWEALWDNADKDENQDVKQGAVYTKNTSGCYLRSEGPALAVIGMKDIVAVSMSDAVLIAPKDQSEMVKNIVDNMRESNQPQAIESTQSFRPWGAYQVIEEHKTFKVKRLTINSGRRLSLQKHQYRSEHWIVVKGVATVTCNDKIFELHVDQSTYIPCGAVHRLENKDAETLEIIEIQTGSYLGEDDIIRLDDDYNRTEETTTKA